MTDKEYLYLKRKLQDQTHYSISLQKAIRYHCAGKVIPEQIAENCPHHAKMMNQRLKELQGEKWYEDLHSSL